MVTFNTTIQKFAENKEKTAWTYIIIPPDIAQQLKPGNRQSFRVKGKLDNHAIRSVALMPAGDGTFIMAINAEMRKGIGKRHGARLQVHLEVDNAPLPLSQDLLDCLADEPDALAFFNTLTNSHQRYFSQWIEDAKTEPTKTKRMALTVNALSRSMGYPEMIREQKRLKEMQ